MKINGSIIWCIIIVIILVAIIIRLATNNGKLMEENYRYANKDPCSYCQGRYSDCKKIHINDPKYDCIGWAGPGCGGCSL